VTVFDNSDQQLKADETLSQDYNLGIHTLQGNMQDLSAFQDGSFDLVFHPVSNCFIDDILPVWRESYRVLKMNGSLLSGFCNPLIYMIDWELAEATQRCELKFALPYSDLEALPQEEIHKYVREHIPFEFGHTLSDQIQGQIEAGFLIAGFYEDKGGDLLDPYTEPYIATRAIKFP
jgi:ubiquinone/menaquinone biosynthesis C-methylase UbiE